MEFLRVALERKFLFVCFKFQLKVTEYVLDENDQLMPMNRLHGENTVSIGMNFSQVCKEQFASLEQ